MGFGLSTSWNALCYIDPRGLLFEIKNLGFREIELSFNLSGSYLKRMEPLFKDYGLRVVSVHNFCPAPDNVNPEDALPDYYSLAAIKPGERRAALAQTKKSIATAARLSATAVVLHLGRVEIPDGTRQLIQFYEMGLRDSQEFQALRKKIIRERKKYAPPFLKNASSSLCELLDYAKSRNVCLGIENRFYYREIPSFEEIGILLDKFKDASIFYWHDTGHARVMENLGFAESKQYLDYYGARLLGFHLHDVWGCHDHLAPSKGEIDFTALRNYLRKDLIKIIEVHHPVTAGQLKDGKIFLEGLLAAE